MTSKLLKTILVMVAIIILVAGYLYLTGKVKFNNEPVEIEEIAGTTQENETTEAETSDWKTYRNEEYGFEVEYPADWLLYVSENPHEDIINIYKNDNPPLTYNSNVTQVSFFPEGLSMDGPIGENEKLTVDLTSAEENIVNQFILSNNNKPFGYFINFKEKDGFIWASVKINNRDFVCRDKTKDLNACEPLADGLNVIGDIDDSEWNDINQILSTFKFTE